MAAADLRAPPAKDRFTSLDAVALARELRPWVGARVDKAFDLVPAGFSLTVRHATLGRGELRVVPGLYAAVVARGAEHEEELSPFAKELRRLLAGAQLTEVPDPAGERALTVRFSRPDAEAGLLLAVELFGSGNAVVARGDRLVAVLHVKRWAHRTVKVGAEYQPPPNRGDPWKLTVPQLDAALRQSRTDRASTLAARLGFGGFLAEELLTRAGLAAQAPAPTDAGATAQALVTAIGELLTEVGVAPAGFVYAREGVLLDAEPFSSRRWKGVDGVAERSVPNFSTAVAEYFASLPPPTTARPDPAAAARGELERQRAQQAAAIADLTRETEELRGQADALLAAFSEVTAQLEAERARAEPPRDHIEIEGRRVPLRPGRTVRESANALYEDVKRLQAKLAGARAALEETEQRLVTPAHVAGPGPTAAYGTAAERPRKAHWFERYRWFISSEGAVVIGGHDAASNDLIVRRYLNPADIYVHADIHGAPSVIVKHPPPGRPAVTEVTYREAGQWGFAFSKAWRAGLASGAAFWVTPDQVSKSGGSGEFVARGAWVIHGTKHPLRDLPTELAIGTIAYEGETLWSVAPPAAIAARGTVQRRLAPGEERDRAEVEIALARELELPRSRLQALLPAGGLTVRRV